MSRTATVFRLLVASPGDLNEERLLIRKIVGDWNSQFASETGVVFLPIEWETHARPAFEHGLDAQSHVNEQIVHDCDLVVGMFRSRLGTPTSRAQSGTVEEIMSFVDSGKPVLLYFSEVAPRVSEIDGKQLAALQAFQKRVRRLGALIWSIQGDSDFETKLGHHLTSQARALLTKQRARVLLDPKVEKVRWSALDSSDKNLLYSRFNELAPKHNLPLSPVAESRVQIEYEQLRPIDFSILRTLLEEFGFESAMVNSPCTDTDLAQLQSLRSELTERITYAVIEGIEGQRQELLFELYDFLSGTDTGKVIPWNEVSCDAVLVPGARRGHTYRVDVALQIVQHTGAAVLLSGNHPSYDAAQMLPIGEAEAMEFYLQRRLNGRPADVRLETRARTTLESLTHLWSDLVSLTGKHQRPIDICVVTSPYHMRRLLLLAEGFFHNRRHIVRSVSGVLCSAAFDRSALASGEYDEELRLHGIGVYVQELLKIFGGRAVGEF